MSPTRSTTESWGCVHRHHVPTRVRGFWRVSTYFGFRGFRLLHAVCNGLRQCQMHTQSHTMSNSFRSRMVPHTVPMMMTCFGSGAALGFPSGAQARQPRGSKNRRPTARTRAHSRTESCASPPSPHSQLTIWQCPLDTSHVDFFYHASSAAALTSLRNSINSLTHPPSRRVALAALRR